jgi:hypothetical protein
MRRLVAVVLLLAILVALALVVDRVVADMAEERAEERVSAQLDAEADVALHGSFTGLRLLAGLPVDVEMRATHVPLDDVPAELERLDVTLTGVRIGIGTLLDPPEDDLPPADEGRVEARLGADATFALANVPTVVASIRIADGAVRLRVLGNEASADVQVRDGEVVIVPRSPLGALLATDVPLDISGQPGDPRIEEAEIDGDVLVLRGVLQRVGDTG